MSPTSEHQIWRVKRRRRTLGRVPGRRALPLHKLNGRKAALAKFANSSVFVMPICECVPEVEGMIAARDRTLDIPGVFQDRPAIENLPLRFGGGESDESVVCMLLGLPIIQWNGGSWLIPRGLRWRRAEPLSRLWNAPNVSFIPDTFPCTPYGAHLVRGDF